MKHRPVRDTEHHVADLAVRAGREAVRQVTAHHSANDAVLGETVVDVDGLDGAAVAQDGDRVRYLHHLVELVRDDDRGDPVVTEFDDEIEQVPAVGIVERRGGLVQDQQPNLLGQRLGDLHELLLADADIRDAGLRAFRKPDPVQQCPRLAERLVPADDAVAAQLVSQEEVFSDRQVRHQRELLVNDRDATALTGPDVLELARLPVEQDLAVVAAMRIDAAEDLHQRRLARPVLPADRVDGTGLHRQIHLGERLDPREFHGDSPHLEQGRHRVRVTERRTPCNSRS